MVVMLLVLLVQMFSFFFFFCFVSNFCAVPSADRTGENSSPGRDLVERILTFEPNSDDSLGDEGDVASLDDLFS